MANGEFIVRELTASDLDQPTSFFETLSNLSQVGDITPANAKAILQRIHAQNGHLFVAVQPDGTIIGTTTLLIEQKFIHEGGLVGHIEDVATHKNHSGKGVGRAVMEAAILTAKQHGCYKIILDCGQQNVAFYAKLGFKEYEICMRKNLL